MKKTEKLMDRLNEKVDHLALMLEKMRLAEYLEHFNNRKRIIWNNFWGGVARGLGNAIGFTILGALIIYLLKNIAVDNLPLIGDFIADIVEIVESKLK